MLSVVFVKVSVVFVKVSVVFVNSRTSSSILFVVFVEISDPSAHSYGGCAPEVQQLLELESMEEASQVKVDSVLTSQIYVTFFYV